MVPPCSDRISRVPPYSRIVCALRIRGYHPLWPDFPDRSTYLQTTTGLFRVRSPLLAESLLMSFPPGTEMFQFPGFASYHYGFMVRYPCGWVAPFGYPRINACSRLPVAFRSVPRPSSPPGAKASTECPYRARDLGIDLHRRPVRPTMHRSHPHPCQGTNAATHGKPRTYLHMQRTPPSRAARIATPLNVVALDRVAASMFENMPLTGQTCDRRRAQRRTRT